MDTQRRRPFLTARWENLVLLNYEIDPVLLSPHVPVGTELDPWNGRHFVSIAGFQFLDTRQRDGGTLEYQVEHPRWRVWTPEAASFPGPAESLYDAQFGSALSGAARSAFLAAAGCAKEKGYEPGLGELMTLNQMRHAKLWFAGQAGNWQVAAYEVEELEEGFADVVKYHPAHKDSPLPLSQLVPKIIEPPLADRRTRMKMPALFLGHGSPLNAIEDNAFRRGWADVARRIPRPGAVLCISAHWKTRGLAVTASERPETIHDFCGFPPDLFAVRYPAPGDPALAPLREEGVLVIGSGDIVHNLRLADFSGVGSEGSDGRTDTAEDWAERFDRDVRQRIRTGDLPCLISCRSLGPDAALAIPTPEHYLPLLYVLACGTGEPVSFFNEGVVLGSISMTCVLVGDTA